MNTGEWWKVRVHFFLFYVCVSKILNINILLVNLCQHWSTTKPVIWPSGRLLDIFLHLHSVSTLIELYKWAIKNSKYSIFLRLCLWYITALLQLVMLAITMSFSLGLHYPSIFSFPVNYKCQITGHFFSLHYKEAHTTTSLILSFLLWTYWTITLSVIYWRLLFFHTIIFNQEGRQLFDLTIFTMQLPSNLVIITSCFMPVS